MNAAARAVEALDRDALLAEVAARLADVPCPGSMIAMEFAFEHVEDGFEDCDPLEPGHADDFAAFLRTRAAEELDRALDDVAGGVGFLPDGRVEVWREVLVPEGWEREGILSRPLGVCWAWDEASAEAHQGEGGGPGWQAVVIHGAVDADGVDWPETVALAAAARHTVGEEQEIRLRGDALVEVLGLAARPERERRLGPVALDASHLAGRALPAGDGSAPVPWRAAPTDDEDMHGAAYAETGRWGREGAGCLVIARSTGRALVFLRSEDVTEPFTWNICSGAVDAGTTAGEQALRELAQEAGYEGDADLVPVLLYEEAGFSFQNFLALVDDEFVPILNWESADARWVEPSEWPEPMHFGLRALLDDEASLAAIEEACATGPRP